MMLCALTLKSNPHVKLFWYLEMRLKALSPKGIVECPICHEDTRFSAFWNEYVPSAGANT